MTPLDNRFYRQSLKEPLLFRIIPVFTVVAFCIVFAWVGFIAYAAIRVTSDPASIGKFVGEIARGFNETQR